MSLTATCACCMRLAGEGLMPCPISTMYGATKAFLTEFAVSIAAELNRKSIIICSDALFALSGG